MTRLAHHLADARSGQYLSNVIRASRHKRRSVGWRGVYAQQQENVLQNSSTSA